MELTAALKSADSSYGSLTIRAIPAGFAVPANVSAMANEVTNAAPLSTPASSTMIFATVRLYH